MDLRSLENKLKKILLPRFTTVHIEASESEDSTDYFLKIEISLARNSKLFGFFPTEYEPDIKAIFSEVTELESKGEHNALYFMEGTCAIIREALPWDNSLIMENLTEIKIPGSATKIYPRAFSSNALKRIIFSEGVKEICSGAFTSLDNLTSIILPKSIERIGNALKKCPPLALTFENEHVLLKDGLIINKDNHELAGIYNADLQSVEIPNGVEIIGKEAFKNCSSLQFIQIPSSVKKIGESAFYGCSLLKEVILPNGVIEIGPHAFDGCDTLKKINIPSGIDKISNFAFCSCHSLKNILIPEGVSEIGEYAFYSCIALKSIILPENLLEIGSMAFYNCAHLKKINLPKSIEILKEDAFKECNLENLAFENDHYLLKGGLIIDKDRQELIGRYIDDLENVVIPEGILTIGERVFWNCSTLYKIKIPESVVTIGAYAFSGCKDLEYITFPKRVNSIGKNAFEECTSLKKVNIPTGIQVIKDETFIYCRQLESVILPEALRSIGSCSFYGCSSLKSITLPKSLEKIGERAFSFCNSLTEVTIMNPNIPLDKTSWFESAFKFCSSLSMVHLPLGLTHDQVKSKFEFTPYAEGLSTLTIDKAKNEKIKRLKEIALDVRLKAYQKVLEATVELKDSSIVINAKFRNGSLLYSEIPYSQELSPFDINYEEIFEAADSAKSGTLIIIGLSEIKKEMFKGRTDFSTIRFPENLTKIGSHAFENCSSLKSIVIPEGVKKINSRAFYNCSSLERVVLPNNLNDINFGLFSGCRALRNIQLPKKMVSLDPTAFHGCNLKDLDFENHYWLLKDGVIVSKEYQELIGTYVKDLENLIIPEGIKRVKTNIFTPHPFIKTVVIPGSMNRGLLWNTYTFRGFPNLHEVTMLEGVTQIGFGAFMECSKLENVKFPTSVKDILAKAFSGCYSLKRISLPNSLSSIRHEAFKNCISLQDINIPDGVTVIPKSCFEDCWALKNITLTENLTKIEERAFAGSALESITIPIKVKCIEAEAFANCSSLKEVTIACADIPLEEWNNTAFAGCTALSKVTLPEGLTWEQVKDKFGDSPLLKELISQ